MRNDDARCTLPLDRDALPTAGSYFAHQHSSNDVHENNTFVRLVACEASLVVCVSPHFSHLHRVERLRCGKLAGRAMLTFQYQARMESPHDIAPKIGDSIT